MSPFNAQDPTGKIWRVIPSDTDAPHLVIPLEDFIKARDGSLVLRPADLPHNHWAERSVATVLAEGLMETDENGNFNGILDNRYHKAIKLTQKE